MASTFPDRLSTSVVPISTDINTLAQGLPTYRADRTYEKNVFISDGDPAIIYLSLVASNLGNTPASSPSEWQVLATGGGIDSFTFTLSGVSLVGEDQIEFMLPIAITVTNVFVKVDTAPTGTNMIVDINKNGTTIFTTQTGRPIILSGQFIDTSETPDITAYAQNDILGISVDQVGSTVPGGDNLYIRVNFTT